MFRTHTLRLVSLWGCPETSPMIQYTIYTSGGHHTAQGHTLLHSTLHTLQEATTWPKGPHHSPSRIPYVQEHSIPSNAQSYYETTRLQISQLTQKSPVSKGYSKAYQQKISKSAKQQSKGLYLVRANKGSNGLGPSRPPCQLDDKIHALLHRTIFMENT